MPETDPALAGTPWKILPLPLPVVKADGEEKVYLVQPLDYDDGMTLIAAFNGKSDAITNDSPDEVMFRMCMGEAWQQMIDDKLPYPVIFRAGTAATKFQTSLVAGVDNGEAVKSALAVWESGIDPELVAALVAAANSKPRPPKATTSSTRSKRSAAARKTQQPASTSTTRSRATTPRKASATAVQRSPGKRS